jgi:hypothetical protein
MSQLSGKCIISFFAMLLSFTVSAQEKNDTIKVLARLVSEGVGDKIHIATYQVLKVIKGSVPHYRIRVGYYSYKQNPYAPDTALLTMTAYKGSAVIEDYYIFPENDANKGIEKVKTSIVDFHYWEGCETGKGDCSPLTFRRCIDDKNWFLILPCGGTFTSVTLSGDGLAKSEKIEIGYAQCPPVFDLSRLKDGNYSAYMLACGLGGGIRFSLKTKGQ